MYIVGIGRHRCYLGQLTVVRRPPSEQGFKPCPLGVRVFGANGEIPLPFLGPSAGQSFEILVVLGVDGRLEVGVVGGCEDVEPFDAGFGEYQIFDFLDMYPAQMLTDGFILQVVVNLIEGV